MPGVGVKGTVLMLTFGTGVGSALFTDGVLVRNTEFGHIEIRGKDAEKRASEHGKVDARAGAGRNGPSGCLSTCSTSRR